jgi:hypothetical protein
MGEGERERRTSVMGVVITLAMWATFFSKLSLVGSFTFSSFHTSTTLSNSFCEHVV